MEKKNRSAARSPTPSLRPPRSLRSLGVTAWQSAYELPHHKRTTAQRGLCSAFWTAALAFGSLAVTGLKVQHRNREISQKVRRNQDRFPGDFMFQLTREEKTKVVTNCDHLAKLKFSPSLPYAFSEHGALMLENILKSSGAVEVSLHIVRTFVKLREILSSHKELALKLDALERKVGSLDQAITSLLEAIRQLMFQPTKQSRPIGFTADIKASQKK